MLFSACYSATGASIEIFMYAVRGEAEIVVSDDVLTEVRRNLLRKKPQGLLVFEQILETIPHRVVNPDDASTRTAAEYTVLKDASIVAAAQTAAADYLVSLDLRHLVDAPEVAERSGLNIVLPVQMLGILREAG